MPYQCTHCGQTHDDLPDLVSDRPHQWWTVPEEEREERIELSSDCCIIDKSDFFIRGVLEIPLIDDAGRLGFGVWVSQKKENFLTYVRNHESDEIGPFFGWLCTRLPMYEPETLLLKTMAHFRGGAFRPSIELEPTGHPLAVEQRDGITLARAWEIVHSTGILDRED